MGGEQEADALTAIFGRSSCPEMTHECFTSVSYHNKNPNFYDEVKIRLPADLSAKHHLLFTFYHISCQKKAEQPNVETAVAYTVNNMKLNSNQNILFHVNYTEKYC